MNKKILILTLLTIYSVHTNNAMMTKLKCRRSRSYRYERPKIEKNIIGIFHPDFPREVDKNILKFIATNTGGETLKKAAQIFNALACTNKFLNDYMNHDQRTLEWIKAYSRKFGPPNIDVAKMLYTKAANSRFALQTAFFVGWDAPQFDMIKPTINKLKEMELDLDFTYNREQPTALIQATARGAIDMGCWLINNGADINVLTPRKQNAAMLALMGCNNVLMHKFLDHPGFKVNHQDSEKYTALHCCFYYRRLVTGNRQIDKTRCQHIIGIVKKLLDKGANPTVMNVDGNTPLDLAKEAGYQPLIDLLEGVVAEFEKAKL